MTPKPRKATTVKWQDLNDGHVGRTVRLTFPWDTTPTTATVVSVGKDPLGFTRDPNWTRPADDTEGTAEAPLVPSRRHVLDYGGKVGRQETQLAGVLSVELEA